MQEPASEQGYIESGTVPMGALAMGVLAGAIAALPAGILFEHLAAWSPGDILHILIAACGAGGVGWVVGRALRVGQLRNKGIAAVVGGTCGLLMAYVGVVYFVFLISSGQVLIFNAGELYTIIDRIGAQIKGGDLGLVALRLLEIAALTAAAGWASYTVIDQLPYCEGCQQWCAEEVPITRTPPTDASSFLGLLATGQFAEAVALTEPSPKGAAHQIIFHIFSCPGCTTSSYLSAAHRSGGFGFGENRPTELIRHMRVAPDAGGRFRAALDVREPKKVSTAGPGPLDGPTTKKGADSGDTSTAGLRVMAEGVRYWAVLRLLLSAGFIYYFWGILFGPVPLGQERDTHDYVIYGLVILMALRGVLWNIQAIAGERPLVAVDSSALTIRAPLSGFRNYGPIYRIADLDLPWERVYQIYPFTTYLNGIPISSELVVVDRDGTETRFSGCMFSESVKSISKRTNQVAGSFGFGLAPHEDDGS